MSVPLLIALGAGASGFFAGRVWPGVRDATSSAVPVPCAGASVAPDKDELPLRDVGGRSAEPRRTGLVGVDPGNARESHPRSVEEARSGGKSALAGHLRGQIAELVGEHRAALARVSELSERIDELEGEVGLHRDRHEYDLREDDWRRLGEEGTLKVRYPCNNKALSQEKLRQLGLQPEDWQTVREAQKQSAARRWNVLRPLCARVVGDAATADKMGPNACKHQVIQAEQHAADRLAALRRVAAFRAGDAAAPALEQQTDLDKLFLSMTGELFQFEAELAESLGEALAHEVTYSDDLCFHKSVFRLGGSVQSPDGPRGRANP